MNQLEAVSLWVLVHAARTLPLLGAYYWGEHVGRRESREASRGDKGER